MLPGEPMLNLLEPAFRPCANFGTCNEAVWDPEAGHVPRGFLGATGDPSVVEIIMVFAEPGNPQPGESYSADANYLDYLTQTTSVAYECFSRGRDLFHRNTRWFLDQLYPGLEFDEILNRVWMTEGRLCSFYEELGGKKDVTCANAFLRKQVAAMPNANIVAFGGKSQDYLRKTRISHLKAFSLAPPGANQKKARPSWQAAIDQIKEMRGA